jgi:glycosyltransferase involved in cell wall biosynthesis
MFHGMAYKSGEDVRIPREWGDFVERLAGSLGVSATVYAPLDRVPRQRAPDFSLGSSRRLSFSSGPPIPGGALMPFLRDLRRLDAAFLLLPGLRGVIAAWACRAAKVPYIVYDGLGGGMWDPPGLVTRLRAHLFRRLEPFALRGARGATVAGVELEDRVANWCEVLPVAPITALQAPPEGDQQKKRTVLFVGSLSERKGIPELLTAWERMPRRIRSGWELKIVGAGALSGDVARFAQHRPDCAAPGYVPHGPELYRYYEDAAILVLPSHNEGFPRVLLEGAAYGCALATTQLAGIAAEFNGSYSPQWLVPGDVASLIDALSALMVGAWPAAGKDARAWYLLNWSERSPSFETAAFIRTQIPGLAA